MSKLNPERQFEEFGMDFTLKSVAFDTRPQLSRIARRRHGWGSCMHLHKTRSDAHKAALCGDLVSWA